ncbi:MAG: hypothetical protein ACOX1S_02230 [Anaerostipes sp.]
MNEKKHLSSRVKSAGFFCFLTKIYLILITNETGKNKRYHYKSMY